MPLEPTHFEQKTTTSPVSAALVMVSLALVGCATGGGSAAQLIHLQAANDLPCPEGRIVVREMSGSRYEARGCGRRQIYQSVCLHLDCTVNAIGKEPTPWRGRPDPSHLD
jgi:hypothetical protein